MKKLDIKSWGMFLVVGCMFGIGFLIYTNHVSLWNMILHIPLDLIVSYLLGGLSMYVIFYILQHKSLDKSEDTDCNTSDSVVIQKKKKCFDYDLKKDL